jgi:hypothetical protein
VKLALRIGARSTLETSAEPHRSHTEVGAKLFIVD